MIDWIVSNKEWFLSGLGVTIVTSIFAALRKKPKPNSENEKPHQAITNSNTVQIFNGESSPPVPREGLQQKQSELTIKQRIRILFVDDDRQFKIVSLLRKSGWENVEIVSDIQRLDSDNLKLADIVFLDIQGVGKRMGFADEGLGLARAIRDTYPDKKIVIYSAVTAHDPFADGFRAADDRLPKNAEPYEFQKIILDLMS